MGKTQDIDYILRKWPFQPGVVSARLVRAAIGARCSKCELRWA